MKINNSIHWNNIVSEATPVTTGRNTIIGVDLSKMWNSSPIKESFIKIGDTLRYAGDEYKVKGVESTPKGQNINPLVFLQIKLQYG
jgi:hypothetical protein